MPDPTDGAAGKSRGPRQAPDPAKPMRLASVVVEGYERMSDPVAGSPPYPINRRSMHIVGANAAECIAAAKHFLGDDDGKITNWRVIDGGELAPESNDPINNAKKWNEWLARAELKAAPAGAPPEEKSDA